MLHGRIQLTLPRTSTYLFVLESQFCVCIGSFPSTPVDEFTGDLPCSELEFAKGQPASQISTNFSNTRSFSLKSSLDLLMSGDDPSCDNDIASLQGTSIFGFFTIIGGTTIPYPLYLTLFSPVNDIIKGYFSRSARPSTPEPLSINDLVSSAPCPDGFTSGILLYLKALPMS